MSNTNSTQNSVQINPNNSQILTNSSNRNSKTNLTNEENKQIEILLFLDSLTAAITGFHLSELGDKMEEVSSKCLQIFLDYVNDFLGEKYGAKEAMRIRAANKFNDQTVFDKFTGLNDKFSEAWDSFVEFLARENAKNENQNSSQNTDQTQINSQNLSNLQTQNAI